MGFIYFNYTYEVTVNCQRLFSEIAKQTMTVRAPNLTPEAQKLHKVLSIHTYDIAHP